MKTYYVYFLASQKNGTLYTGVTNNITRRVWEHKNNQAEGFTKKYTVKKLVYLEEYTDIQEALTREKQIKNWRRSKKLNLFEKQNPNWDDLYESL